MKTRLEEHQQLVCYSITQPETSQTYCKLWILPLAASCSKSFEFIKLQQVCENQTCCKFIFADLLQVVETVCINLVDKKS